jgi:hypothetical protein
VGDAGVDAGVPSCATGPVGRARWVYRELAAGLHDRRDRRHARPRHHPRSGIRIDVDTLDARVKEGREDHVPSS